MYDDLDFSSDPYNRYLSQNPMAAAPYLPYDNSQGGTATAPSPVPQAPAAPPGMDIGSTLDDVSQGVRHWAGPEGEIQHKGLFGIHGTMRDILGYLGDALTGKSHYADTKQSEAESDAMRGFQEDPQSSIDRMVAVDPDKARAMAGSYASQTEREAAARTAAARAEAARAQINQRIEDQVLQRAAGIVSLAKRTTLKDGTVDPENMTRVRTAVQNLLKSKGITLPDGVTVDDLPGYATSSNNQYMQDYRDDVNDIRGQNADERGRHDRVTEGLGAGNLAERGRHDVVVEGQGSRRLDQGDTRLTQTGQHYQNVDANAATRTGWGPPGRGRRGVASVPTVTDAASYNKLPNGAAYIDPHGNLKHKGVK